MLHKVMFILKAMRQHYALMLEPVTVGELSRITKVPYTTVKRTLERAENSELIASDMRPYKKTGKRVYWLTEKGSVWCDGNREMF